MKTRKVPATFNRHTVASPYDKALTLQQSGQYDAAVAAYDKLLEKNPDHLHAQINLGLCHYLLLRFNWSSHIFHQLHVKHPENDEVVKFAGISYMALGNFEVALQFLKMHIGRQPEDFDTWLNLTSASGSNQNNTEALYYATQALSLKPIDARSHLNLGAALLSLNRWDQALYAFETALTLEPGNIKALMNCATIYDMMGNQKKALKIFASCLPSVNNDPNVLAELQYKMSFPLLSVGELERGWTYYNAGFIPVDTRSRFPKRKFDLPEWDGQPLKGKRLLVWREQGLGDEIRFASVIPDLREYCDNVVIECEPRLVSLFQRSFNWCKVREQATFIGNGHTPSYDDYDFHIPLGSLMRFLRNAPEKFAHHKPYLVPDPVKSEQLRDKLESIRDGRSLIGICWRSGFVNSERNIHYTPISDWGPLFENPNLVFVNLQYGTGKDEVAQAEAHFGIKLHQWDDLDLKDDQEGLAALITNLDCVVSADTAVAALAQSLSTRTMVFTPVRGWVFLGQEKYPWAGDNVRHFFPKNIMTPISEVIPEIANAIALAFPKK